MVWYDVVDHNCGDGRAERANGNGESTLSPPLVSEQRRQV